ncbi:MAG: hypothetical protein AB7G75_26525 [Candidatus Binatia bacterium]
MKRSWRGLRLLFVMWLAMTNCRSEGHAAGPPEPAGLPDAPVAVAGSSVPTGDVGVRFVTHRGEWTSLFSVQGGGAPMLLVSGEVQNTSPETLTYVKLQIELLGADDIVVFRDYVYNRRAEVLRDEAYEQGKRTLDEMNVEPLPPAMADGFRFILFKEDIPEFRTYRVRVLEAH